MTSKTPSTESNHMLVTGKVLPCKTQRGEMERNQWKTNLTRGSYIQRNRGNCLTTGGNSLARNKVSDKKKVPETIIFLFYHKSRTQRLFPSCVLLSWVWNMACLSGRFPPLLRWTETCPNLASALLMMLQPKGLSNIIYIWVESIHYIITEEIWWSCI